MSYDVDCYLAIPMGAFCLEAQFDDVEGTTMVEYDVTENVLHCSIYID